MNKNILKKVAATAIAAGALLPLAAFAQVDLGLEYGQAIGLGTQDVRTTVSNVIKAFMGLLGIVAVVIILLGGFKWMTAAGSEEKVSEAKKLIMNGVIGLVVIMMAYAIANFVVTAVTTGTQ